MKFPNKVNRYKTTIIYQIVEILNAIDNEMLATEIYMKVSSKMNTKEFYDGMSVLFSINKIDFTKDGRIRKC